MRSNWGAARDFGRVLSDLAFLTEATLSDLSSDDLLPMLNVTEIKAGNQPKKVTIGSLISLINTSAALTGSFTPSDSVEPETNGTLVFELTDDTTLTIKAKGSDGTVRSIALTLAE